MTFHLIPHTHWDREWFLTRATIQARLVPVLDEVIEQLERDPKARFLLDGQTILLEDYLAIRPEQESRVAALVKRGALEIGPWYVLSDLLIPSAASLRRNLVEGARDSARFGKRLDVLYSPDAFGHPADLPTLAREFGISRAVVRRGLGLPWDFYHWESPGGARVLTHHLPKGGYDIAIDLADAGDKLAECWSGIRRDLLKNAVTDQIAVFLGADHHAMVRNVSLLRNSIQALEPNHDVRISGLTEFFEAVEGTGAEFPVVRGELRRGGGHTWILQDAHSSRSRIKRLHARAEWELAQVAEPLARKAQDAGGRDREALLTHAWRTLLQCQFHDTLVGTTSDAVQVEQVVRLKSVQELAREIGRTSLNDLIGHDPDHARTHRGQVAPKLVLWNPSEHARGGVMTAEVSFFVKDVLVGPPTGRIPLLGDGFKPFELVTAAGEVISVQVINSDQVEERVDAMRHYPDQDVVDKVSLAFKAPVMGPGEIVLLTPRKNENTPVETGPDVAVLMPSAFAPREGGLGAVARMLSNQFVAVVVSPNGEMAVTDHATGQVYHRMFQFLDEGDRGDLYTFSADDAATWASDVSDEQNVLTSGPLVGAIETLWTHRLGIRGQVGIRMVTTLCVDSPVVRVRIELDNHASGVRLRTRIPVGCVGATAGTAMGVETRAPVEVTPIAGEIEREVATAPAHRFVASASGERGLLVAHVGCFEYEATQGGDLVVTLLRSVGQLSRATLAERPGHAAWPVATPDAQEPGPHVIEMAIVPIAESLLSQPEELKRMAEDAILPTQAVFVRDFVKSSTLMAG